MTRTPVISPSDSALRGVRLTIRQMTRAARKVALSTIDAGSGGPYVSLVALATAADGTPLLLLSRLADHSRNIAADPRAALLVDGTEARANPQTGPRVSLIGRLEPSPGEEERRRYLARLPAAALYAGFADFALYRLVLERAHWVGGFAKAVWVEDKLLAPGGAEMAKAEPEILDWLNRTYPEGATRLARRHFKRRSGDFRFTAVDPDGLDIGRGETVLRLSFEDCLPSPGELKARLGKLVGEGLSLGARK